MTAKEKIEQKGQKDRQNSMEIKRENQEKNRYMFSSNNILNLLK